MLSCTLGVVAQTDQGENETMEEWFADFLAPLIGLMTYEESVQWTAFEELTGYQWYIQRKRASTKESALLMNKTLNKIGDRKRVGGKYIIVIATLEENDHGIAITLEGETSGGKLTSNKLNRLVEDAETMYLAEAVLDWGGMDHALSVMEVNLRQSILEELGLEEEKLQYSLPLAVYVEGDYYLTNPEKQEFVDGETISIHYYMKGL
ncbi:MAG: hypothetical protein ABJP45_12115, partial [Cyclobacteriaceae bacterium]